MNIATMSLITIQLKLINEYDPIFKLLAMKMGPNYKYSDLVLHFKN